MTDAVLQDVLDLPLAEIGLCNRTLNDLDREGLVFVHQLLKRTPSSLLAINGFGRKRLDEVYRCLETIGLKRRSAPNLPPPTSIADVIKDRQVA